MNRFAFVTISGLAAVTASAATSYTTGFEESEGYVTGASLYMQNNWTGGNWSDPKWNKIKDGEMVTDTVAHTGSNSWYFPGGPTTEGAGTPFSPALGVSVGAPAYADYSGIKATLWFKAASPNDGSSVNIHQASVNGNDRTGFNVYITNGATGISIGTYRWDLDAGKSVFETIVSELDASQWHSIDVIASFADDRDDKITYIIDRGTPGEVVSATGNTWTHLWRDANDEPYVPGDGLKFAWGRDADANAQGFYFDDISYEVVPEPAALSLLGLGGLALLRRRRA